MPADAAALQAVARPHGSTHILDRTAPVRPPQTSKPTSSVHKQRNVCVAQVRVPTVRAATNDGTVMPTTSNHMMVHSEATTISSRRVGSGAGSTGADPDSVGLSAMSRNCIGRNVLDLTRAGNWDAR
jgi:hypothetical protein